MPDTLPDLLAAATNKSSPDVLQQIPGSLERGVTDLERLPFFAHLSEVMPAADMFFGGTMLVLIILVHAAGVRAVTRHVISRCATIMQVPAAWRADLLMGSVVFLLLALHVVEMFIWSAALVYSGLVPDWRTAGFFSGNTYTTVGYGAFVLPVGWHMLAPIIAMSGLFAFGWSGSVLVDYVRRINAIRDAVDAAKLQRKRGS
ncbi:MAG TPA: ion channel [Casimicrobiaceae bacterium]|nr:ion channel [Casimicrobiaceae bacterium]